MREYLQNVNQVVSGMNTSTDGLSQAEAAKRLSDIGPNRLVEGKKPSLFQRFMKELANPMIIVLIVAAAVSGITAVYSGESFADVIIILAVVVINSVLGVLQESKAEKAISALQQITAATSKVIRGNHQLTVKSEEVVPGDIIVLEAGDAVPADARIIESASMKVEESALTGESVPVNKLVEILELKNEKDIPLGDRKNMVYMGGTVVYGRGRAVVTSTGMNTEMGKIADALTKASDEATPLQKRLNQLSKMLSVLVIGICIVIFALGLFRSYPAISAADLLDTFMVAVSLAVAAIPEGLAAVVTIVLSIGVTNMSRRNAVIRKLTAVETLGCTQIICSDKTGTLTQNKMTVTNFSSANEKLLATAMSLCSDADLDENNQAVGEPTECALVNYAYIKGINKAELKCDMPRIGEAPFDSGRKMMSTVHKSIDGNIIQFTKGAPDEILKRCSTILTEHGEEVLTESAKQDILNENKRMADSALRVLCAAQRIHNSEPTDFSPENLEQNLCYIGLTGMIDPIRPEVKDAINKCKTAGIRPIMITGDHLDTAVAIAMQLGILDSPDSAITGSQLNEISDDELKSLISKYSVFARVQPEHKVRIVNAWRANGMICAMTGDGVNDAPAIKSADIGIGMGITGTDVTKNVADMVLADDNFATIVSAVEEGRRIYDNIRKSIQFLLSSNLSEVLAIFIATLLGFTILEPVHLLWINLITDCLPALALGIEKSERNIMKHAPRRADEGIFSGGLGTDVVFHGLLVTVFTLFAYFIGHYIESGIWEIADSADGVTMAFLTLSMVEIFHSFNMRSRRQSVFRLPTQNKLLWAAMGFSLILTTTVIYVPFLSSAFGLQHISLIEYATSMLIAILIVPVIEIAKAVQRRLKL